MSLRNKASRFYAKVRIGPACWEWGGWRQRDGYGVLTSGPRGGQRKELAHRLSWEFYYGPVPAGMFVCHHCDNPPCVRPSHLFLGTQLDNMRDAAAKGRINPSGKLTPEQVRLARTMPGTIRAIGAALGMPYSMVSKIRLGKAWKSVV